MKKFRLLLLVFMSVLLALSACRKEKDGDLSFIDESETTEDGKESAGSGKKSEETVSFSKDYNQHESYNFWMDSGRIYYRVDNGGTAVLYTADPVSMTYRPLCRKEGCLHNDDSCFSKIFNDGNGLHTGGTPQLYGDGIYEPMVREKEDGSGVLEYYRMDPDGGKPKTVVWEIPLDGLMFTTDSYMVYPYASLHRGYCIIESTSQQEGEKADLEQELGEETGDGRGYNRANPYNEIAAMRYDDTVYVSVYDLEKKVMQPVLEKTVEGVNWLNTSTIAAEDDLYIFVRPTVYAPVSFINDEGLTEYDLDIFTPNWEIYRWHFGSGDPAGLIYSGNLCEDMGGMQFQNGQLLFLENRKSGFKPGLRGACVLCSLDFDTGRVSELGTIYEESETAYGQAGAYFSDGMIIGRKFTENPQEKNSSENIPEVLSIYNLNGVKETDISFDEDLPPLYQDFYVGVSVCGTDGEVLYCNNSNYSGEIVFYIIPINGGPVQYFTPAPESGVDKVSPEDLTESADEETVPAVYDDEDFREMDPTSTGLEVAFAQDDNSVYFPYAFGAYGREYVLCSADKLTGRRKVLCDLPDCPHNTKSCEAYAGSNVHPFAMTVTNRRLYAAVESYGIEQSVMIRAYDLETKEWSEIASVGLNTAGIQKNGCSMQNWQAFFHRDCFYYYVVRTKSSGSFPSFTTTELTAIIYEVPLNDPSAARFILNEDYPMEEFNSIWLNAAGSGDRILYTVYANRYRSETETDESGEENYTEYLENPMLQIGSCGLSSGKREILYETREARSVSSLYPEGDYLYYMAYVPKGGPDEPAGQNDLNLYRFDTKNRTDACAAGKLGAVPQVFAEPPETEASETEDSTDNTPVYYSAFFCRNGYFTYRTDSSDTAVNPRLYCTFYDLNGEKIREFDYEMPDSLKVDPDQYNDYPVFRYLGADLWNLYFSDTYQNEQESLCLVYAVPAAGDTPVVFE